VRIHLQQGQPARQAAQWHRRVCMTAACVAWLVQKINMAQPPLWSSSNSQQANTLAGDPRRVATPHCRPASSRQAPQPGSP
jgi:hypothetical protein